MGNIKSDALHHEGRRLPRPHGHRGHRLRRPLRARPRAATDRPVRRQGRPDQGAPVEDGSLEDARAALVSKIGENIQVRRVTARGSGDTTTGAYVHMQRIGVLVEIEGGTPELCTDVAMHVAAMSPAYATKEDVPAEDVEKERKFLTEQVADSGKPES